MKTLIEIDKLAAAFEREREALRATVAALNDEVLAAKKRYLAAIRGAVARTAAAQANVLEAVQESPGLFTRPKTQILHGLRVGWVKQRGGLDWDDTEKVVERIHRHFGGVAKDFLHVKETPDKDMLERLSADELKRLGVRIVDDGEQAVAKPVDGEVDKIVAALLKDAVEQAEG